MKAVIFDMDGVLIDSMKYHVACWIDALAYFGIDITERDVYMKEGMNFQQSIESFAEEEGIDLKLKTEDELKEFRTKCIDQNFEVQPYPNMLKFIHKLRKNKIKIAMVTGSNRKLAQKVVDEKFNKWFDVIVTGDDVKISKPSPDPYLKAVKMLKLPKEECLVIENAPLGIKSAKDAGLFVIGLETTLHRKELCEANIILNNHKSLYEFLEHKLSLL